MTINKDHIIADLEQHIMECWRMVDDVNLLYEQVMENDLHKDQDKLANALLGLCTIYEMKFEQVFNTYEKTLKPGGPELRAEQQRQSNMDRPHLENLKDLRN